MRILIIRHGEPNYSIDSLTEKGWREVELLSQRLTKMKIDAFYVSPLGRARDTANATLQKLGKEAEVLPWLEEFRGKIKPLPETGRTMAWDIQPSFWQADKQLFDYSCWADAPFLEGGTVKEIYQEATDGIDALLARYGLTHQKNGIGFTCTETPDKTIALFCHFALGSTIVGYLTGISPFILWHTFFMPTSSVTTLVSAEMKKGEVYFRCMQMGDTSHLYAAGEPVSASGLMPEFYDPNHPRCIH